MSTSKSLQQQRICQLLCVFYVLLYRNGCDAQNEIQTVVIGNRATINCVGTVAVDDLVWKYRHFLDSEPLIIYRKTDDIFEEFRKQVELVPPTNDTFRQLIVKEVQVNNSGWYNCYDGDAPVYSTYLNVTEAEPMTTISPGATGANSDSSTNVGGIIGLVIGGVILIFIGVLGIICGCRKRRRNSNRKLHENVRLMDQSTQPDRNRIDMVDKGEICGLVVVGDHLYVAQKRRQPHDNEKEFLITVYSTSSSSKPCVVDVPDLLSVSGMTSWNIYVYILDAERKLIHVIMDAKPPKLSDVRIKTVRKDRDLIPNGLSTSLSCTFGVVVTFADSIYIYNGSCDESLLENRYLKNDDSVCHFEGALNAVEISSSKTDSNNPKYVVLTKKGVYTVDYEGKVLKLVYPSETVSALTVAQDERILVADVAVRKIFSLNLKSGSQEPVKLPEDLSNPCRLWYDRQKKLLYVADNKPNDIGDIRGQIVKVRCA